MLARTKNSYTLEYACQTSTGMQWFIAVVTPLGNDENRRLMIVQHNITERKLAEDALRKKKLARKAWWYNSKQPKPNFMRRSGTWKHFTTSL